MEQYSPHILDELLGPRSLEGDRKSLEELIIRYSSLVYNLITKMIRNKDDAADLSQEVFIQLSTKLDGFKHNSSFKTWLYKITVNHVLNYRKGSPRLQKAFRA
jgi:RNA polymerase sigma factor (sigma-70 family)